MIEKNNPLIDIAQSNTASIHCVLQEK